MTVLGGTRWALLLLVALCRSSACGQKPPEVGLEQLGLTLLNKVEVQKELAFTKPQKDLVEKEFRSYVETGRTMLKPGIPLNEQKAKLEQMRKLQDALCSRVLATLSAPQRARYRELALQAQGIWGVLVPEVSRQIGLKKPQRDRIVAIQKAAYEKLQSLKTRRQRELSAVPEPTDPKDKVAVDAYRKKIMALVAQFREPDRKTVQGWARQATDDAKKVLDATQTATLRKAMGTTFKPK